MFDCKSQALHSDQQHKAGDAFVNETGTEFCSILVQVTFYLSLFFGNWVSLILQQLTLSSLIALAMAEGDGHEGMAADWFRKPVQLWGLNGTSILDHLLGDPRNQSFAALFRQH
ncbi:hypothetical protein Q667_03535 [Marinobacter sp. C1S70]|nr:hypothetical protein Q667_03535 [Marinobacter sp. C1S70]